MRNHIWILMMGGLLTACTNETPVSEATQAPRQSAQPIQNQPIEKPAIIGLAMPIQLSAARSEVLLSDIFLEPEKIDSVSVPQGMTATLSDDKGTAEVAIIGDPAFLSVMTVFYDGESYSLLLKTPTKKNATLRLRDNGYKKVQVKGEMNAWNPASANMTLKRGIWEYTFQLAPGNYQYQFVVDGKELLDPKNPQQVSNGMGGMNSLLALPKVPQAKRPMLRTLGHTANSIQLQLAQNGRVIAFWQNRQLQVDQQGKQATIQLPAEAAELDRSFIRAWAQNEFGVSNDILIPLQKGRVLTDTKALQRSDYEAQIMYFPLVDRFNNGSNANDAPVEDERVLPLANYLGGDLKGITQKIKDGYFKSLNINSLWLSPITQNPQGAFQEYPEPHRWYTGYHGYWPVYSAKVDERFGTEAELKELVEVAHENGINILLDYICNHVHQEHPIYQQHPEWATQLELSNGQRNLRLWDEHRLTTWFDEFLPSLDLENPTVIEVQTDSAMYWVKAFGMDGYRHDATKHIPLAFWRRMTEKLQEEVILGQNRPIFQIGETYGSRELIQSYIKTGLLDAQFDFPLYFDAREVFAQSDASFKKLAASLEETFSYFGYHSTMGNISGNHDQARVTSLAGGGLAFDEDSREAGFSRTVEVGDPIGYQRIQQLQAFNFAIPGIPVVYYGDEIGMPGGGDPDSRRMMRFEGLSEAEQATLDKVRALSDLRSSRLSLIYGDTKILLATDTQLVLARYYFGEWTIIAFNKSKQAATVRFDLPADAGISGLKAYFGNSLSQSGNQVSLQLPGTSFDYLLSEN
ncbi:MAG: hypothetical protein KDC44_08760 [Phaeodactylibacter sp.]|nr:hypothetical protein [Phaeodactylibacter sp.]